MGIAGYQLIFGNQLISGNWEETSYLDLSWHLCFTISGREALLWSDFCRRLHASCVHFLYGVVLPMACFDSSLSSWNDFYWSWFLWQF